MKIGLVLPATPAYSETFFRSKISVLQTKYKFKIILFVDKRDNKNNFDLCVVKKKPRFSSNRYLHIIQVISLLLKVSIRHPGKTYLLFKANYKDDFTLRRNLASLISSAHVFPHQLDWIHFGFGTMALGRENLAKVIGAKLAVSFRGYDIGIYPLNHRDCYKLLWTKLNKAHVISEDIKNLVIQEGLKDVQKIHKIFPAIDIEKFTHKAEYERKDVTRIVTVARLHWKKGLDYTILALAKLRDMGYDFKYTIIGEGAERERLLYLIDWLKMNDEITLLGKLTHKETIIELSRCDIYVQYSVQEGFCNAVLEAQAMGHLCIVSDAEGLPENIIDKTTGWVVPKRRPSILADQIRYVIDLDSQIKKEFVTRAKNRVEKEFGLDKQSCEFYEFYTQ